MHDIDEHKEPNQHYIIEAGVNDTEYIVEEIKENELYYVYHLQDYDDENEYNLVNAMTETCDGTNYKYGNECPHVKAVEKLQDMTELDKKFASSQFTKWSVETTQGESQN